MVEKLYLLVYQKVLHFQKLLKIIGHYRKENRIKVLRFRNTNLIFMCIKIWILNNSNQSKSLFDVNDNTKQEYLFSLGQKISLFFYK